MSDSTLTAAMPVRPRSGTQTAREQHGASPVVVDLLAAADAAADAFADRLHDDPLQALVVARYAADACVRGADPTLARDAVQQALVALRRAVWDLRPRGEDDLPAALAELSQNRAATGAPLELRVDAGACAALAPAARSTAYRFVQAAAPASGPAVVEVRAEAGVAVVEAGGTPSDLAGWAARATALGGSLHTDGPTARLLLPLHTNPDPDPDPEGDR